MFHYTLTPAYGRDYKSKAAVLKDFVAGLDFVMQPQSQYCSIRDIPAGATVNFRYRKMRTVFPVEVTEEMKTPATVEPKPVPGTVGAVLAHKRQRNAQT